MRQDRPNHLMTLHIYQDKLDRLGLNVVGVARIFGPHVRLLFKMHEIWLSYLSEKSLKLLPPDALIIAQNIPKCVWRPGSGRTRWGSLSAPPDPLAAKGAHF